ncbi:hypothetical protein B1759_13800 [Rubrivirga sp. SAORIC476]|uniref:hypothetical protein n=1 Tax=Rubrivirga sp. SAORIC476 TaxID=1961794 RepID=UPI000BA8FDCE|nr:hypothetical protein [Rubrivirga sp. SAORIC476]PAP79399.1 hypothetical protein B1759_13800 [Rubrivirga sp. SAORIC476]
MLRLRSALSLTLALGAVLALGACDTTEDTALDVFVVDFNFDSQDYIAGNDLKTATFDARDAAVTRGDLGDALQTAGDGALVMLYIDVELVSPVEGASGNVTWAALPLSRSFEEIVLDDQGEGSTIPVVGYTASYEYSFDNQDLYFDIVSSAPYTDFSSDPRDLFDFIAPQRQLGGSSDIDLRLVVIPDELFYVNGSGARIDVRDYEAVKAAFDLPD